MEYDNNHFIIASRAYFLQNQDDEDVRAKEGEGEEQKRGGGVD
jgi:hypothetical protein